jgi:hypothetical protein
VPHDDRVLRALCEGLTPWQQVETVAARQGRAIHLSQLRDCGLGTEAVKTATARRQLNRVHRGVRAVGIRRLSPAGLRWAAFLAAGPDTALSHDSGAALSAFRPHPLGVHLSAPTGRRNHSGVTVHEAAGLCPAWIRLQDGLPVLKPPHLLLDLAVQLDPDPLAIALIEALARRVVRLDDLERVIDERAGHHGRSRLAKAIAAAADDPGEGRTHGELEELVLLLMRGLPGLPPFLRNELVELGGGRIAKADMLFPGLGVMIELDSRKWHEQRLAMDSDRRRDQQALAVGIITFRITWRHATREWEEVASDLLDTLAARITRRTG